MPLLLSACRTGCALALLLPLLPAASSEAAPCRELALLARLVGEPGWRFGSALAGLGDIDGDGTPDLAIGAPGASPRGLVLVYSGRDLSEIRRHEGLSNAPIGAVLAVAGDVDRDGVSDLLVGAPTASAPPLFRNGRVFVFSGRTGVTLHDIPGQAPLGEFGFSVAPAGDMDFDRHDDFVVGHPTGWGGYTVYSGRAGSLLAQEIGRPYAAGTETAYALASRGAMGGVPLPGFVFGSPGVTTGVRERLVGEVCVVNSLGAPPALCRLSTVPFHRLGEAVVGLGDLDGDRRPDFAVAAPGFSPTVRVYSGRGELLHEHSGSLSARFGRRLGNAGDVDGDRADDLLIGGPEGDGRFWLRSGLMGALQFERAGGPGERLGEAFASLGDFTGDGRASFAVGAPLATVSDAESSGAVLIFGRPAPRVTVRYRASRFACAGEPLALTVDLGNHEDRPLQFRIKVGSGADPMLRLEPGDSTTVVIPSAMTTCPGAGPGRLLGQVFWRDTECNFEHATPVELSITCEDCRFKNCPRPLAFWQDRCTGDPDAWPLPHDWSALRDCVTALARDVPSPEGLCADLAAEDGRSGALIAARAEFLTLLLNHCSGGLTALRTEEVRLRAGTPIDVAGVDCDDLACLIDDFNGRFRSLGTRSEREPEVVSAYRILRDVSRALNFGRGLQDLCTLRRELPEPPPSFPAPGLRLLANPVRRGFPVEVRATLDGPARVTLELFSVTGRRVRVLEDFEHPGGVFDLAIPLDDHGLRIPAAGLYIVRMTAPGMVRTTRIVLLD